MNRKSFLSTLLIAIAAPFIPIPEPQRKLPKAFLPKSELSFGPKMALIGDGVGTSRSNPEVIAPLDRLKGLLGDTDKRLSIDIKGRIRGRDLRIDKDRLN